MLKEIGGFTFEFDAKHSLLMQELEHKNNVLKIKISLDSDGGTASEPVIIRWKYPCGAMFSQWNPQLWSERYLNTNWMPIKNLSRAASGAPIQTHMTADGTNVITVYLSDVSNPVEISTGVIEETAELSYKLVLFSEYALPSEKYETELIIDTRKASYEQILNDAANYWDTNGCAPSAIWEPVYSTWYAHHQNLNAENLLSELAEAKKFGMSAVIIDDGWQTYDSERGYAYCGDWQPKKLGDMKQFVCEVHKLGMKCMLWYSVPFIGMYTDVWERFKDKVLNKFDKNHPWCVLDPRYAEVREYLLNLYERAVSDWDIDGLKLDFINNMQLTSDSPAFNGGMDCKSLDGAICILINEIRKRLTDIKKDIVFEFRQPYTGPAMRECGGIQRAADCPLDAFKNRTEITDLRLIASKKTAVHSDMLMWDYSASAEAAALQLINVMFSVPQISMRLSELSAEHRKMLKFYLALWKEYKPCFIEGKLSAHNPEAGYSLISGEAEDKIAAVAYSDSCLNIKKVYDEIIFINGSWNSRLYIQNDGSSVKMRCIIYDCTGGKATDADIMLKDEINSFNVPKSGVLKLKLI